MDELGTLQELTTALEQLRIAEEDLRIQNSALLSANSEMDRERDHYAALYDSLPAPYILTSTTGSVISANLRALELLQVPEHLLIGKPLTVFVPERLRRDFRHAVNQLATGRASAVSLFTVLGRSPELEVAVTLDGVMVELGDGNQIGWLVRRGDSERIAERERLDEEHAGRLSAERTVRRFRLLTEASRFLTGERDIGELCTGVVRAVTRHAADHCAIYLIEGAALVRCAGGDHDPAKAAFAEKLLERFRITPDDSEGLLWRAILTGDPHTVPALQERDGEFGMRGFFAELRERGARSAVVLPLRRKDHSFGALVALVTSPAPALHAEDAGMLAEIATRTALAIENAKLMQKLEQANQEKTDFMGVLSHELRTPLSAVIGYTDLLLSGIPEPLPERARQHVERIRSSAWHQLTIVEQLLTHTRPLPNPSKVVIDIVNLSEVVAEVTAVIANAAAQKGLKVESDVPAALTVRTDAGRLRQILINLLNNAVKYTHTGEVGLRVRGSDDTIDIAVFDSGPGIAPEIIEHVFEPYWRGTDETPGMGLGLSVSRKLAQLLGGEITAESKPGAGSTFTLRLRTE
jgi:signal transduction histidine kinase